MTGGNLQSRLDNVFGALSSGINTLPSWKPTPRQVFRGGDVQEAGNSSDEDEFHERVRREIQPGVSMDLADDDAPDEEGFMPSAAFCRQVDMEAEMDVVDFVAVPCSELEDRPGPGTEVLDDNIYEMRITLPCTSQELATGLSGQEDVSMSASPLGSRGSLSSHPSRSSLRYGPRPGIKKRVSFTGIPEPWVPPHKRAGYIPKVDSKINDEEDNGGAVAVADEGACPAQRPLPGTTTRVPDHVLNPQKYTRYDLEHPLTVGGGIGQLADEAAEPEVLVPSAPPQQESVAAEEPERWQGGAGAGVVAFRQRTQGQGRIRDDTESLQGGSVPLNATSTGMMSWDDELMDEAEERDNNGTNNAHNMAKQRQPRRKTDIQDDD